jgi:hypothetical protein
LISFWIDWVLRHTNTVKVIWRRSSFTGGGRHQVPFHAWFQTQTRTPETNKREIAMRVVCTFNQYNWYVWTHTTWTRQHIEIFCTLFGFAKTGHITKKNTVKTFLCSTLHYIFFLSIAKLFLAENGYCYSWATATANFFFLGGYASPMLIPFVKSYCRAVIRSKNSTLIFLSWLISPHRLLQYENIFIL